MFGIGFQEMLIILVVVLIIFGPKRLPDLAKSLGKGIAEFKKASEEVRKGIDDAIQESEETVPPPAAAEKDASAPGATPPVTGEPPAAAEKEASAPGATPPVTSEPPEPPAAAKG